MVCFLDVLLVGTCVFTLTEATQNVTNDGVGPAAGNPISDGAHDPILSDSPFQGSGQQNGGVQQEQGSFQPHSGLGTQPSQGPAMIPDTKATRGSNFLHALIGMSQAYCHDFGWYLRYSNDGIHGLPDVELLKPSKEDEESLLFFPNPLLKSVDIHSSELEDGANGVTGVHKAPLLHATLWYESKLNDPLSEKAIQLRASVQHEYLVDVNRCADKSKKGHADCDQNVQRADKSTSDAMGDCSMKDAVPDGSGRDLPSPQKVSVLVSTTLMEVVVQIDEPLPRNEGQAEDMMQHTLRRSFPNVPIYSGQFEVESSCLFKKSTMATEVFGGGSPSSSSRNSPAQSSASSRKGRNRPTALDFLDSVQQGEQTGLSCDVDFTMDGFETPDGSAAMDDDENNGRKGSHWEEMLRKALEKCSSDMGTNAMANLAVSNDQIPSGQISTLVGQIPSGGQMALERPSAEQMSVEQQSTSASSTLPSPTGSGIATSGILEPFLETGLTGRESLCRLGISDFSGCGMATVPQSAVAPVALPPTPVSLRTDQGPSEDVHPCLANFFKNTHRNPETVESILDRYTRTRQKLDSGSSVVMQVKAEKGSTMSRKPRSESYTALKPPSSPPSTASTSAGSSSRTPSQATTSGGHLSRRRTFSDEASLQSATLSGTRQSRSLPSTPSFAASASPMGVVPSLSGSLGNVVARNSSGASSQTSRTILRRSLLAPGDGHEVSTRRSLGSVDEGRQAGRRRRPMRSRGESMEIDSTTSPVSPTQSWLSDLRRMASNSGISSGYHRFNRDRMELFHGVERTRVNIIGEEGECYLGPNFYRTSLHKVRWIDEAVGAPEDHRTPEDHRIPGHVRNASIAGDVRPAPNLIPTTITFIPPAFPTGQNTAPDIVETVTQHVAANTVDNILADASTAFPDTVSRLDATDNNGNSGVDVNMTIAISTTPQPVLLRDPIAQHTSSIAEHTSSEPGTEPIYYSEASVSRKVAGVQARWIFENLVQLVPVVENATGRKAATTKEATYTWKLRSSALSSESGCRVRGSVTEFPYKDSSGLCPGNNGKLSREAGKILGANPTFPAALFLPRLYHVDMNVCTSESSMGNVISGLKEANKKDMKRHKMRMATEGRQNFLQVMEEGVEQQARSQESANSIADADVDPAKNIYMID